MLDTCAKNRKNSFSTSFLSTWVLWRLVQVKKFDRSGSIRHFTLAKLPSSSFLVLLCTHTMTLAHMASNKKGSPLHSIPVPALHWGQTTLTLREGFVSLSNFIEWFATMLQKLSKCEVKAWLCLNLIILPPLWIYMKSNFGEFKRSKMSFLAILETLNFEFLLNLELETCLIC